MNAPRSGGKADPQKPDQDQNEEEKRRERMQRQMRFSLSYIVTALIVLWLFQEFILAPLLLQQARQISYSEFRQKLAAGQIVSVTIGERDILGQMKNPDPEGQPELVPFDTVFAPGSDPKLIEDLQAAGVQFRFQRPASPVGALGSGLLSLPGQAAGFLKEAHVHRPAGSAVEHLHPAMRIGKGLGQGAHLPQVLLLGLAFPQEVVDALAAR